MPEPTRLTLKIHYKVKVYIYTKEKKHSTDMLVLCLPEGQLKIYKVNMVEGRFELFKSSASVQRMLGKKQTSREKHWPDMDQLENSRHFFSLTSPNSQASKSHCSGPLLLFLCLLHQWKFSGRASRELPEHTWCR